MSTTVPSRASHRRIICTGSGIAFTAAMLACATAATASRPDSTINVSPHSLRAGAQLTISGDAPTNARSGKYIYLESMAFDSAQKLNGVPEVRAQVSAQGTYRVTDVLLQGLKTTTYAIIGEFQGKPFSQVASITITPGPDSTLKTNTSQTAPGGTVKISGDAPTYAPSGETVTVSCTAFTKMITTQISAQGTYATKATVRSNAKAGNYTITGNYHGHYFSQKATITVR